MKLDELLPALTNCRAQISFALSSSELAQGEGGLVPGAEYPVWSPYEAHDAAATLTQCLREDKS
jgi:hypothetical protein